MKKIRYIGTVTPWVDTLGGSGRTWTTGMEAYVSDAVGLELSGYPSLFIAVAGFNGDGVSAEAVQAAIASDQAAAQAAIGLSPGGGAVPQGVTSAQIIADTAPASPGTWPSLTTYYISDSGAGVDPGTQVVWIPTGHATLPAAKGWRFAFYPSATVM